ncbi:MAG: hypothetical protein ACP5QT_08490 [Brevinematia bacterium]
MGIPVYSEISNFSTGNLSKKRAFSISIVFLTDNLSASIEPLNSIYKFISNTKFSYELIIINLDKISYNYDVIFSTFPFVRILFPQEKANYGSLFKIGISESLSRNILFLNQDFRILNFNLDILNIYFSETSFGIIIPLILNEKEEIIPGVVKMDVKKGFLTTFSMDIKGTAISSLYPKYPCFIINKNAFLSNPDFYDYTDEKYFLLELGYKVWKAGFIITQARNFKVLYSGMEYPDLNISDELEYLVFNLRNITLKTFKRGRKILLLKFILKRLILLDFKYISRLMTTIKETKKIKDESPVEDSAILTIINNDIP